jgi:hypothetical protein
VSLPSVIVARSAFSHDAAYDVDESDDAHPESVSAAAITTAENIPKRLFNVIS